MDKMTANDLVAMLLNIPDEDGITEFKRLGLELRISKVVETIVAMANTDGGIITQPIARIIKHSCNWRAIKGRVDDHNSLIYKQIPANLWPARNDAIDQLRAKAGYIDQTQEETHQSIKTNYQYINEIRKRYLYRDNRMTRKRLL